MLKHLLSNLSEFEVLNCSTDQTRPSKVEGQKIYYLFCESIHEAFRK
jgi:hypothetical protein